MMEGEVVAAVVLQAHVRGWLVRRRLRTVLQDYEAVLRDIEGGHSTVHWGARLLAAPLFPAEDRHTDHSTAPRELRHGLQVPACVPLDKEHSHGRNRLQQQPGEVLTECQLLGSASVSELLPQSHHDVPTRERQVSETADGEMENSQADTDALKTDLRHLQPESPGRDSILPGESVSAKDRAMLGTQAHHLLHHSSLTTDTDERIHSLEWTRSSSVWSDKSMDTDLSLKNINDLQMHRSHLAMEILWVQQAIASRKNYLMVRERLGIQN